MIKKEVLKEIIRDFHKEPLPKTTTRDLEIPLDTGKIITLAGVRRSGKNFLLFETIKRLYSRENIRKEQVL